MLESSPGEATVRFTIYSTCVVQPRHWGSTLSPRDGLTGKSLWTALAKHHWNENKRNIACHMTYIELYWHIIWLQDRCFCKQVFGDWGLKCHTGSQLAANYWSKNLQFLVMTRHHRKTRHPRCKKSWCAGTKCQVPNYVAASRVSCTRWVISIFGKLYKYLPPSQNFTYLNGIFLEISDMTPRPSNSGLSYGFGSNKRCAGIVGPRFSYDV